MTLLSIRLHRTPLIYAVRGGFKRLVDLLIEHKVHIQHRSRHGRTAVDWARVEGQMELVKQLEKQQRIIDAQGDLFIAINLCVWRVLHSQ